MTMNFGEAERYIHSLFSINKVIQSGNETYRIIESGKPTTPQGEPKTDIYVLLSDGSKNYELKISVKKDNADFLENKTSAERAEQIFGPDWMNIVINSTLQLKNSFDSKPLIYKTSQGKTEEGAITLGWKFELLNKKSGQLSDQILLSKEQLFDIYTGTNLPLDKKNAYVNGKIIENSGVANTILFGDLSKFDSAESVIHSLQLIDSYINYHPNIYFACKALNYRTFKKKYDGDRPLSVFVDWNVVNGKLNPTLIFNTPLITRGNQVANKLTNALFQLGLNDTNDINASNVSSLNYVHF
ncbi:hypothetical protein [Clostridium sp. YIM B02555]|uniref:hypothetical protein n=1 Tax=Clostridium sp. YIM B02555 TaxID=2911968 RepID=UPI001EEEF8AC|nr:hypothetical protein [Clostridium sp. YIM B02555]